MFRNSFHLGFGNVWVCSRGYVGVPLETILKGKKSDGTVTALAFLSISSPIFIEHNISEVIQSDLFGMVKWPFQGLSDLHLGDQFGSLGRSWTINPIKSNHLKKKQSLRRQFPSTWQTSKFSALQLPLKKWYCWWFRNPKANHLGWC